jgi:hypothetical protein
VQAKTLLESVVRQVLLGQRFHGLLFHHRLLDDLLHHFLSHDFSVTCIRQGLQVRHQSLMPCEEFCWEGGSDKGSAGLCCSCFWMQVTFSTAVGGYVGP